MATDLALPAQEDILQIYRLIHELCELGDDAYIWRARMLAELRAMTNADRAVAYVMNTSLDPSDVGPKTLLMINQELNESWEKFMQAGDWTGNPVTPSIMQRFGTDFTLVRQDLISDEVWYASDFYKNIASPADWDHSVYSQVAITPPGLVDGIGLARAVGKAPFDPSEVGIVRFLHRELARLWRRPDPIGIHTLPDRQREVLDGIRRGETRKTIADKMGVSDHTVHTYEKSLFERAAVRSRGELLARLAKLVHPNLLP